MYFWKIDELKKDLIEKPLSEKEDFKYLMTFMILSAIVMFIPIGNSLIDYYAALFDNILFLLALIYFYKLNGGENGKNFLSRFFSISLSVAIRWIVLFLIPVMFVFGLLLASMGVELSDTTTIEEAVFFSVISFSLYWRTAVHMKEVAEKAK